MFLCEFFLWFNIFIKFSYLDALSAPPTTIRTTDIVSAIFNKTTTTKSFFGPCRYLPQTIGEKQNHQCRKDFGLPEVLKETRQLAVNNCETQFRYDRWNCSIETTKGKRNIFKRLYKETAFLYAITAAAMTHSVARACAQGLMMKCNCKAKESKITPTRTLKYEVDRHRQLHWHWDGCDDNVNYGKRITRIFLDLKRSSHEYKGNFVRDLIRHNSETGIQTVSEMMKPICKCHGVSGSCSLKTCWKKMAHFNITATNLRMKYNQAIRKSTKNKIFHTKSFSMKTAVRNNEKSQPPFTKSLYFLNTSPTFCSTTKGRRCLNRENCSILCCGRGHNTITIRKIEKCRCHFHENRCCSLHCDTCHRFEDRFYCK